MKNYIIQIILEELKTAKYYSLIIDSTPNMANIDQRDIALRYVIPSVVLVERL